MNISLDDTSLPCAQVTDHQHLVQVLLLARGCLYYSSRTVISINGQSQNYCRLAYVIMIISHYKQVVDMCVFNKGVISIFKTLNSP